MLYYAGIGSQQTPLDICEKMEYIGEKIGENKEWCLRSGHAPRADQAFEIGCDKVNGNKEIFLPYKNFKGSNSELYLISKDAFEIAEIFHPNWAACSEFARQAHARNVYQILGKDLKNHVEFVICWTKDGGPTGGTGQALRIADKLKIPIFNLFYKQAWEEVLMGI